MKSIKALENCSLTLQEVIWIFISLFFLILVCLIIYGGKSRHSEAVSYRNAVKEAEQYLMLKSEAHKELVPIFTQCRRSSQNDSIAECMIMTNEIAKIRGFGKEINSVLDDIGKERLKLGSEYGKDHLL